MNTKHKLLELFLTFLKIGALTFGGGYAMMPIMRREVVEKKNWASDDDIMRILVISESTPGVLAVNSATFIGYRIAGFKGSFVATLGVVIPSIVTISLISLFIMEFRELTWVSYAFLGIQAGVAILIFRAALKLAKKIKFTLFSIILLAAALLTTLLTDINVLYLLVIGSILGIVYGLITNYKEATIDDNSLS